MNDEWSIQKKLQRKSGRKTMNDEEWDMWKSRFYGAWNLLEEDKDILPLTPDKWFTREEADNCEEVLYIYANALPWKFKNAN